MTSSDDTMRLVDHFDERVRMLESERASAQRDAWVLHGALAEALRRCAALNGQLDDPDRSVEPLQACRAMHAVRIDPIKIGDLLGILGTTSQLAPETPEAIVIDDRQPSLLSIAQTLYAVLLDGRFYQDHDESAALLGTLRRAIERERSRVAPTPGDRA